MSEATHTSHPQVEGEARLAGPAAVRVRVSEVRDSELRDAQDGSPRRFREFAEKGVSQAKDNYEKMKAAAEEATDVLEDTYATATKGAADYGLKLIEASRVNTNAAFDFYTELMTVKSYSEVIELSTAHARKQFEAVTAQTKDLAALAQKVATETAEPIKDSVTKAFRRSPDAAQSLRDRIDGKPGPGPGLFAFERNAARCYQAEGASAGLAKAEAGS